MNLTYQAKRRDALLGANVHSVNAAANTPQFEDAAGGDEGGERHASLRTRWTTTSGCERSQGHHLLEQDRSTARVSRLRADQF